MSHPEGRARRWRAHWRSLAMCALAFAVVGFSRRPHTHCPRCEHKHTVRLFVAPQDIGSRFRGNDKTLPRHLLEQLLNIDMHHGDEKVLRRW